MWPAQPWGVYRTRHGRGCVCCVCPGGNAPLPQRHIQDPASQRLTWSKSPKSVLVIKKIRDASLLQPFKELCVYLMEVSRRQGWGHPSHQQDPALGVGGSQRGSGLAPGPGFQVCVWCRAGGLRRLTAQSWAAGDSWLGPCGGADAPSTPRRRT